MSKFKIGFSIALILFGFCFISIGLAQFGQKPQKPQDKNELATPIQEGVMTDRQREHGKIFKGHGIGKKITDLLKETNEVSLVRGEPLEGSDPNALQFNLNDFIRNATCNSDSVIIGTVTEKTSQLTNDAEFVFTDYTLTAETVLKDNNSASIQPENRIIVTRSGGKVKIGGKIVTAIDKSAKPLLNGEKYILFLKYIPSTGAYTLLDRTNVIPTKNSQTHKSRDEQLNSSLEEADPAFLIDTIRISSSTCVSKTQGDKK